jgi:hypothetical protein
MSDDINPTGNVADPVAMIIESVEPSVPEEPTDAEFDTSASTDLSPEPEAVREDEDAEESLYGDDADADTDETPEDATRYFTVKVDGKEIQVPEHEVIQGYQRTADYTRKTSALAEQRKAIEAEAQQVAQERAYYASQLAQLAQSYQLPPEPDYRLAQTDPVAYVQQRAAWEAQARQVQAVQAEQQRIAQQSAVEQQNHYQRHLQSEMERLTEALPSWKDPAKAKQEKRELTEYLRNVGYTDDEIGAATDHRAIVLAKKAAAYDKLMSSRATVEQRVAQAPKTLRPGSAAVGESTSNQRKAVMQKLQRTGGVDAAAAFIAMG